jgi:hypothetical protein
VALLAVVAVGCASLIPTPPGSPAFDAEIHVANGTNLVITIAVNGHAVGVAPSGETIIPPGALPAKPWAVEAQSPTGRVLLSFEVGPGQVTTTTSPDGVTTMTGGGNRADLSCGRLDVYVGVRPLGPPPPENPGVPGDCDP